MSPGKLTLIAAMILAIVIAGCTGSSSVAFDQNAGVRINDFSFDINNIYEGESALLTLKIQNVGAKTMVGSSRLWIYGPTMGGGSNWDSLPPIPSTGIELPTDQFTPPNVAAGVPGALHIEEVELTAPTPIPEGIRRTDTFYARVCYPYETESLTKLVSTTRNQMRIEPLANTDAVTRASAGPVQLKMLSGENLVAISGRAMGIVFEISDVGGGFATRPDGCGTSSGPDVDLASINKITATVTVDGDVVSGCSDKEVLLSKGKGMLFCSYTPGATQTAPKVEYMIDAKVSYNYYLTRQADIVVNSNTI